VSGKGLVNGNPAAPGAKVVFIGEGQKEASTVTGSDGLYTITNPPLGAVRIIVRGNTVPVASAGGEAPQGMKSSGGAAIPPKYGQPGNELTYTVTAGKQTHNIELTP